jgi:hypothetical protein
MKKIAKKQKQPTSTPPAEPTAAGAEKTQPEAQPKQKPWDGVTGRAGIG